MGVKNLIKSEESDISNIFNMFRKRKFEGYTGQAVKNSTYQFMTNAVGKIGSLIFTIIIARLLMPELFGLYSLALSTILLLGCFSDLGINKTLMRYLPENIRKRDLKKTKAYFIHLFKLKSILIIFSAILILALSKFISQTYYQKPIFLALLAGSLYIIFIGFLTFIDFIFYSTNKFKYVFYKEIVLQFLRIIIVPIAILLTLKYSFEKGLSIFTIILASSLTYFLVLIPFTLFFIKKTSFLKEKYSKLTKKEKKSINKFIIPLSATVLSGIFFGYVDIVILGRFVLAEYIGYYKAAFSLIGALIPLVGFSAVLLPIFSTLKGKRLERGLNKSIRIVAILAILGTIFTIFLSSPVIKLIFGSEYYPAINLLRILSILLIALPISNIYDSYFISKGKTKLIAILILISLGINIILNYFLISWLINYSFNLATIGAAIATIISRYFYLFALMFYRK